MTETTFSTHPPGSRAGVATVATVGTFDGLHRGHAQVLERVRSRAADSGRRSLLVTFDPHPLRVVRPEHAPLLLTTLEEKKELLRSCGLDEVAFVTFTEELSRYEPDRFVKEILLDGFGVEELVIGYDHGFGRDRSGGVPALEKMGSEMDFTVDVVPPVAVEGAAISSSRIRALVGEGKVVEAAACLGRPYSLRGTVVHGDGRGRDLGFPTANLNIPDAHKLLPPQGIYAVMALVGPERHAGALHLGPRPTFEGAAPSIEVHLIDFDRDIYGQEMRIDFVEHLRAIAPFTTIEALVDQIREDVDAARRLVETVDQTG